MPIQTDQEIAELIKAAVELNNNEIEREKGGQYGAELLTDGNGGGPGGPGGPDEYPGPGGRTYPVLAPWTPRKRPDPADRAKTLYFYYLKFGEDGSLKSYFSQPDIPSRGDILSEIDTLVTSEINSARELPTSQSVNIENREWSKHSYIAVYLDNSAWELIDVSAQLLVLDAEGKPAEPIAGKGNARSSSLHFPVAEVGSHGEMKKSLRNRTFFNAMNRTVTLQEGDARYLLVENLHLDPKNGRPRKKPSNGSNLPDDDYKFDVFYRVAIPNSNPGTKLTMIVDPAGRNLGP
ncbi:MAG: hypothetical protein ABJP48_04605 [Erythrobacter sp.]